MASLPADREAARFLRRLASRGARPSEGDQALAAALLRRGLVARAADGALALTAEGASFLRRHLSGGDPFAAQHRTIVSAVVDDPVSGRRRARVNADESPLDRLRRLRDAEGRPVIDDAAFAAGERLRSDFTRGRMQPRVTANWSANVASGRRDGGAGGVAELTEAAIAARMRVEKAMTAVGPEFSGVLLDVCCFLKGIEEVERTRCWPVRSGKLVLKLALASLARHYGLAAAATGPAAGGGLRRWGTADYRPKIA